MSLRSLFAVWLVTSAVLVLVVPGARETVWFFGWRYWHPRSDGLSYVLMVDWWAYLPAAFALLGALALLVGLVRRYWPTDR